MKNPELMERLAATGARLAGLVVARVFLDGLMPPNGIMSFVVYSATAPYNAVTFFMLH